MKDCLFLLVGLPGFEPRQTVPKTVVLPLHHNPIRSTIANWGAKIGVRLKCSKNIIAKSNYNFIRKSF